jgi:hypothetical protein
MDFFTHLVYVVWFFLFTIALGWWAIRLENFSMTMEVESISRSLADLKTFIWCAMGVNATQLLLLLRML